jgi:hypothetical protein
MTRLLLYRDQRLRKESYEDAYCNSLSIQNNCLSTAAKSYASRMVTTVPFIVLIRVECTITMSQM